MKHGDKLGLYIPDMDKEMDSATYLEWEEKGSEALSLCTGKEFCVQAGGNVGYFAIKLAKHFNTVLTYEPLKENYECLVSNVDKAGCHNILHKFGALGGFTGKGMISDYNPRNCGATKIKEGGDEFNIVSIDSLSLPALDLLWLDVEGFEWDVIQGSLATIRKYKPVIIAENNGLIKQYPSGLNGSEGFVRAVEGLGYKKAKRIMRDDFFIPN